MADGNNKFEQLLTRLLETNNDSEFTRKFTANRRDTLPYIFAIDSFIRLQNITDDTIAFRKIIKSLDDGHRNLFMSDHVEEEKLTINMLKIWLLERYPPPPMKHEWIIRLKQIRMRKNEDPLLVYQKFLTILDKVNRAINYLNSDLDENSSKRIPKISDELKHEILSGIFIRNNNEMRCNNRGTINKETRKYIAKKDPTCYKDWKPIFLSMEMELIPRCYQTLAEYQYQTYPFCANEYDIYLPPKKKQTTTPNSKNDSNRKRKHDDEDDKDNEPSRKRQKKGFCNNCGKKGHHAYECRSKQKRKDKDVKPHRKPFCKRCKRDNHVIRDCRATRYSDGAPIRDDKTDRIRREYRSKHDKDDARDRGDRYSSKRGRRNRSRSRSRDRSDDRGRWGDRNDKNRFRPHKKDDLRTHNKDENSYNKSYQRSIAALSKGINEDLDLDAEEVEQMQKYLTKIAEISARHS